MKIYLVRAAIAAASAFAVAGGALLAYEHSSGREMSREPVLVELYTSATCPSCPAAEGAVASLVRRQPVRGAKIVPMALHVAYDTLPRYKDPLSNPAFVARQEQYAQALPDDALFTPMLVVDGVPQPPGCSRDELAEKVELAAQVQKGQIGVTIVAWTATSVRVSLRVTPMHRAGCDVYVALVEDGVENPGLPLNEREPRRLDSVVREVALVAHVPAGDEEYMTQAEIGLREGWNRDALSVIAFAQRADTSAVVALGRGRVSR